MSVAVRTEHFIVVIREGKQIDAAQLGRILLHMDRMYSVLKKPFRTNQKLEVVHLSKGSTHIHFAGDPAVLDRLMWAWHLIGGNMVWDLIKSVGGKLNPAILLMMRKMLTEEGRLNDKDADILTRNSLPILSMAAKNKNVVILDYNNNRTIVLDGNNSKEQEDRELMDFMKLPGLISDLPEFQDKHPSLLLPPRSKRRKKRKP